MKTTASLSRVRAIGGVSTFALAVAVGALPLHAQDAAPASTTAQEAEGGDDDAIVVTGLRASLEDAMNIKRSSAGVVDAISAEDIGKFPDTNLAESLQRVTGVSIDRASGEGQYVTVRGFGPQFNLVVVNGRQMPTSNIGDGSSRSFDFANLASEGVAGVEIYKSGRASLPTGGIGSILNIKLPRPLDRKGFKGSFGVKGLYDTSDLYNKSIQPEVSGIISDTFADDKIGVLVSGSYQRRNGGQAQFVTGNWRPGYTGAENNWGTLAQPGDPRYANIQNRPEATDIYQVPQSVAYDFYDFNRVRVNGQAVLQFRPVDNLTFTADYLYSRYNQDSRQNSIGLWFNHGDTSSAWSDGPAAGAQFYTERFGQNEGKDLAITGSVANNRNRNTSIGGNVKWEPTDFLSFEIDGHHSIAESRPNSPYGSSIAVGSAIFGVRSQTVDYTSDMPAIGVTMYPGSEIRASNIRPAGQAFTNRYMRDQIDEATFRGKLDFDASFIESLDFGLTYTENRVRSAFGVIQNDTWGGTLSAADTPDGLYTERPLVPDLQGMSLGNASNVIPVYYQIDTVGLITLLQSRLGICNAAPSGTCLAPYSTDQRITEKSWAPYLQSFSRFDLGSMSADLRLGLRYEITDITSSTLAPNPTGTVWVAANEISLISPAGSFATLKGHYNNWLPAVDFALRPMDGVVLRASYSHTISKPSYNDLRSLVVNQPLRVGAGGSSASSGNPGLLPYKSKNIDLSAEWYYDRSSYLSVGFFDKRVSNFITDNTVQTSLFDLRDPSASAAANAARAAGNVTFADIRTYIAANFPQLIDPATGGIRGTAADPQVIFTYGTRVNSDQSAHLWGFEFALQHAFWDTGFGAILNYTVVKSDTSFDVTKPWTVPQFAVTGASDSANAVLFYDKNGLQARAAYNWRARYLGGYDQDPYFIKPYGQLDVSASYEFMPGWTAFAEGINVLNADRTGVRRNDLAKFFAAPGYARYAAGLRYSF